MKILKLRKQIRENTSRIIEPYLDVFQKTKTLLRHDIASTEQCLEILLDFSELLADASINKQPPEELFPDGFDSFYAELVSGIPSYSAERRVKKMRRVVAICVVLAFSVVVMMLYGSGYIDLWRHGMAAFVYNPTRYKYEITEIEQDVNFTINLDNLESNVGKVVYNSGKCRIEIKSAQKNGKQYSIGFRTYGDYDIHGGILITGLIHTRNSDGTYTMTDINSELYYQDCEELVLCRLRGMSGMQYRNGDNFSYYLPLGVEGEITLTLTGLLKHRWYD